MMDNVAREAHRAGFKIGPCGQHRALIRSSPNSWSPAASNQFPSAPSSFIAVERKIAAAKAKGNRQDRKVDQQLGKHMVQMYCMTT